MELALYLLVIPAVFFLININDWYYLRTVMQKHDVFIEGLYDNASTSVKELANHAGDWLIANQTEIKRRVLKAGLHGPTLQEMEPAGYGFVQPKSYNVLDNLTANNNDILQRARQTIIVAQGHFLINAKLSLSPLRWVEILVFLPKQIVGASGINVSSKVADIALKLIQIMYWLIVAALTFFGLKP